MAAGRASAALALLAVLLGASAEDGFSLVQMALRAEPSAALFHLIPKGRNVCLEGSSVALEAALLRLRDAPVQSLYPEEIQLQEGGCAVESYIHPDPNDCFANVTMMKDDVEEHWEKIGESVDNATDEWKARFNKTE